jgi:hypothetical protein
VQAGDTLWSIARGLLGPAAGTAEVARVVDLLWTLNSGAIGTGSPDLIMTGTELQLPKPGGQR